MQTVRILYRNLCAVLDEPKENQRTEYFGNWLYKTLTRKPGGIAGRTGKEQPVEEVFGKEEPETASVLEEVMMRPRKRSFIRQSRNLPVKQRTAVVLYYFNQMSIRGDSRHHGLSEGTVKSRLYTARANLKQELMEETRRVGREVTL